MKRYGVDIRTEKTYDVLKQLTIGEREKLMDIIEKRLLKELNDLLNCNPDKCENCSCQFQDEGDDKPHCGYKSVLRMAISSIEYYNNKN